MPKVDALQLFTKVSNWYVSKRCGMHFGRTRQACFVNLAVDSPLYHCKWPTPTDSRRGFGGHFGAYVIRTQYPQFQHLEDTLATTRHSRYHNQRSFLLVVSTAARTVLARTTGHESLPSKILKFINHHYCLPPNVLSQTLLFQYFAEYDQSLGILSHHLVQQRQQR